MINLNRIRKLVSKHLVKTRKTRAAFFLLVDILLISFSIYVAFLLRFEWQIPVNYLGNFWAFFLLALIAKIPIFYFQGLYHMNWSYVSVEELLSTLKAVTYSSFFLGTVVLIFRDVAIVTGFPRSVIIIDYLITLTLIGGFRISKRIYLRYIKKLPLEGKETLIVGAGDAGEQLIRSILKSSNPDYLPVGFVDDDSAKHGTSIQGVKVLGSRNQIPELVKNHGIETMLIAMPSASSKVIKETVELARKAEIKDMKVLPDVSELLSGKVSLDDIREIQLEDLLGREPVQINTEEIESYLKDKAVLVTGAAGSIGSELCRQIAKFDPHKLILIDHEETALFNVNNRLKGEFSDLKKIAILGDVRNKSKMRKVFAHHGPDVVFHAAAYKHVEMMEEHPDEAVENNVFGTLTIGEASVDVGVEKFILISTDKAVNPGGVMGATKRIAEMVIQDLNQSEATIFSAVRFGNVLGSRGSVVPIFKKQIKKRGPVTVRGTETKRYFMIPSEAVLLVLQAGAMGEGGEVFVLDMGKPIEILDLAKEMIKLSGYEPDEDIPISITELKDGEKPFEDILTAEEGTEATKHKQIFTAKMSTKIKGDELETCLSQLKDYAEREANQEIKDLFSEIFPSYQISKRNDRKLSQKGIR